MMNLELILEALRELSDADYQSALWSGKSAGEQSSFTEAVCVLFDDAGLAREIDSGSLERTYSNPLCQCARKLRAFVALIDDTGTPQQTLNQPKMKAFRELAHELREMFMAEGS
jgi:hypothetical protein